MKKNTFEPFQKNIILASTSPRRIEMMRQNGIEPIIIPPTGEETPPPLTDSPEQFVMFLALKKALSVEAQLLNKDYYPLNMTLPSDSDAILLAADTIVYKDHIIGKPSDREDAFRILSSLNGSIHFVATGVALLVVGKPIRRSFVEITKVFFKKYSDDEIYDYVNTSEPYDKAGGYAIQGTWGKQIDHIDGDFANVIGFPWNRIQVELNRLNQSLL